MKTILIGLCLISWVFSSFLLLENTKKNHAINYGAVQVKDKLFSCKAWNYTKKKVKRIKR